MCREEKQEEATKGKVKKEKPEEKEQTSYGWSANREHYLRVLRATSLTSPRASTETMAVTPLRCGVTVTPPDAFFCYGTFCERKQTEPTLNFRKWLRTERAAYLEHYGGTKHPMSRRLLPLEGRARKRKTISENCATEAEKRAMPG